MSNGADLNFHLTDEDRRVYHEDTRRAYDWKKAFRERPAIYGIQTTRSVIACEQKWWDMIVNGTASHQLPDPYYKRYSVEEQDRIISRKVEHYKREIGIYYYGYWKPKGVEYPPDFNLIQGSAREAFCQDLRKAVMKGLEEDDCLETIKHLEDGTFEEFKNIKITKPEPAIPAEYLWDLG